MIELYVMVTLLGVGYWIKQNSAKIIKTQLHPKFNQNERPSMNTIYDSTFVDKARSQEYELAKKIYQDSIPGGKQEQKQKQKQNDSELKTVNRVRFSELAGANVDMSHANMLPFFRGSLKEVNADRGINSTLETYTGMPVNFFRKQEARSFFPPSMDITYTAGAPVQVAQIMKHIVPPQAHNNYFPIESVRVGPGLNKGYTNTPSGGFQQPDANTYAKAPTIDQLRVGSQKQSTYTIEPTIGLKEIKMVHEPPLMCKNRVERFYEKNADSWFITTGSRVMDTVRSAIAPIKRFNPSWRYFESLGPAGTTNTSKLTIRSAVRKSTKLTFAKISPSKYGMISTMIKNAKGIAFDHATNLCVKHKKTFADSRRDVLINLTSAVKSLVSPFTDPLKATRKYFPSVYRNPRLFGQLQRTLPPKSVSRNPYCAARKTIKQTTIDASPWANITEFWKKPSIIQTSALRTTLKQTQFHSTILSNLNSTNKPQIYVEDIPKSTIKQTLLQQFDTTNVSSFPRGTIPDMNPMKRTVKETTNLPSDVTNIHSFPKTTVGTSAPPITLKESIIQPSEQLNMVSFNKTTVYVDEQAKPTIKENVSQLPITGLVSHPKTQVYTIDHPLETIKQQTTQDTLPHSIVTGDKHSYVIDGNQSAKTTTRNTVPQSDENVNLIGVCEMAATVYDPNDRPAVTQKETLESMGRVNANINAVERANAAYVNENFIMKPTNKETTCDIPYYGQASKNYADAYLVTDATAKPTNKQYTSDNAYFGTAINQDALNPMSYDSSENTILNESKQRLEVGREPTLSGVKTFNSDLGATCVKSHKISKTRENSNFGLVHGNKLGEIVASGVTSKKQEYENSTVDECILENLAGNDLAIMNAYCVRQKLMK